MSVEEVWGWAQKDGAWVGEFEKTEWKSFLALGKSGDFRETECRIR